MLLRYHNCSIRPMNRTTLLLSVRSAAATIPYPCMPSFSVQAHRLAVRFTPPHWHAGTVGGQSLSALTMTTMPLYDERGKCLMRRRQLAVTGHGRPKVTFYFMMLSCPAD
jgi:hypothetical protein